MFGAFFLDAAGNASDGHRRYDGRIASTQLPPMNRPPLARSLALVVALLSVPCARADGIGDLKAALARLQAQTPLKATLDVKTAERHGEGAEALDKQGQASVAIEDGAHGLQVAYARDTLARMDAESRQLVHDPKAKTPTVWALAKLDASELMPLVSATPTFARNLEEDVFKGEKPDTWNGKAARLLTFTVPISKVPEQQRKYVKAFDATWSVWIAADGTPLASETRFAIKGRAFVVVSFEGADEQSCAYGVVGDRLVTLRSEEHSSSSGAGEREDRRVVRTLQPE